METVLSPAQEIINPTRENIDIENSSSATGSPSDNTGIIELIKKKVIEGREEDTNDAGAISPPDSKTTSPALKPVGTASKEILSVPVPISTSTAGLKPISPPLSHPSSPTSPIRSISPPSPPPHSRQFVSTASSTRISSASSSQIFERNVQESHSLPIPPSNSATSTASKIPAHIATENHIPAVLEASSIAITDGNIDPEDVEIAMLTTHQPLGSQVSQHGHKEKEKDKLAHVEPEDFLPPSTSHSGHSLGPSYTQDKRRLSFISFSDIVQAEQADLLDSTILSPSPLQTMNPGFPAQPMVDQAGLSGITETLVRRRSPSPMRRVPGAASGSPPRTSANFLPERSRELEEGVMVETMGQALRKTGSGDLGKGIF